jgi:hypothetical protein
LEPRTWLTIVRRLPAVPGTGTYQVKLLNVEAYWTAANKRIFSVSAGGIEVMKNIDLFAQAGNAAFVATDNTFLASVSHPPLPCMLLHAFCRRIMTVVPLSTASQPRVQGLDGTGHSLRASCHSTILMCAGGGDDVEAGLQGHTGQSSILWDCRHPRRARQ